MKNEKVNAGRGLDHEAARVFTFAFFIRSFVHSFIVLIAESAV
jgi:hypothetical protein